MDPAPPPAPRPARPRGRVLRATFGCNPNSSSLGVDVTFLIFGSLAIAALTPVVAAFVRAAASSCP